MRKNLCCLLLAVAMTIGIGHADGLPLSTETHDVYGHSLQLSISTDQKLEITRTGYITFEKSQLELISKFYPKCPKKVYAYSPAVNDSMGDDMDSAAFCIWTRPDTIAISLNQYRKGEGVIHTREKGSNLEPLFRLSPEGVLYSKAKPVTLDQAKKLLLEKLNIEQGDGNLRYVRFVTPPKYRDSKNSDSNEKVRKVIERLIRHGKSHKIEVYASW